MVIADDIAKPRIGLILVKTRLLMTMEEKDINQRQVIIKGLTNRRE